MRTLEEILQTIHRMYEGDVDYPESGEDYNLRVGFVNDAINQWALVENVKWRELFKEKTGTTDGTAIITCPSDFSSMGSFLKIDGNYYEMIKPQDLMTYQANYPSDKWFYISGGAGNYQLNVNPTPDSGLSYSYFYYKTPTTLSSSADKAEMSKPMYIVYFVLAKLYELDNRNDMVQLYEQKAFDVLSEMLVENESLPPDHPSNINDKDYKLGGWGFGE